MIFLTGMLMSRFSLWNFPLFSTNQSSSLLQYGKPYSSIIKSHVLPCYLVFLQWRGLVWFVKVRFSAGACEVINLLS